MNYTFGIGWPSKPWTILDDKIIIGKKEYTLADIVDIDNISIPQSFFINGTFHVTTSDGKCHVLAFLYKQKEEAVEAIEYIKAIIKEQRKKENDELKAELKELMGDEFNELIDLLAEPEKPKEIRMRCNVCGHIFCYTDEDIKSNEAHLKWARAHAVGSLFGTRLDMYGQSAQMQDELDKVVDFSRCPNCKSTNLTDISNEEISEATQSPPVQTVAVSAADELKKFKELLDMGIITQEEIDAKKKQLLGL